MFLAVNSDGVLHRLVESKLFQNFLIAVILFNAVTLGIETSDFGKAHAETLGIDAKLFEETNIHIHVPEGATPKDGPSAGITMLTALTSAFTKKPVKPFIAMTGEITLRGRVLPVGGIKEKILAAKRAGIKEIIMCHENEKNVLEIDESYIKGLKFHYVKQMEDVLKIAL